MVGILWRGPAGAPPATQRSADRTRREVRRMVGILWRGPVGVWAPAFLTDSCAPRRAPGRVAGRNRKPPPGARVRKKAASLRPLAACMADPPGQWPAGRANQRWRALKRGFDLPITKTLPRRRTTLQSR